MSRSGAMGAALQQRLAPLRARWDALPVRDRRALLLMTAVLAVALAWWLVVAPVRDYAAGEVQRLAAEQDNLAWMQANASAARQAARAGRGLPAGQSLLAVINASAREAGLNLQRFEPEGEQKVRVTLENAVFTDVMRWVVGLESRYGVVVLSLNADHPPAQPGLANIRLTLGRGD